MVVSVVAFAYMMFYKGETTSIENTGAVGTQAVTIVRTDSGYEPNEVTIKKGDIVLWKNESSDYHWPASDLHPTLTVPTLFALIWSWNFHTPTLSNLKLQSLPGAIGFKGSNSG